jgi:hypothetical protein
MLPEPQVVIVRYAPLFPKGTGWRAFGLFVLFTLLFGAGIVALCTPWHLH